MLPLPTKNRPMFDKKSSCEIMPPTIQVSASDTPISTSNVEMYEYGTNLWNEMAEELENETGEEEHQAKSEQEEELSSLNSKELEDESKSNNYRAKDVEP